MFKLFFEETYIIVVPSYKETLMHKHNMLHVFFGSDKLSLNAGGKSVCGNVIILENDVEHKAPAAEITYKESTAGILAVYPPDSVQADKLKPLLPMLLKLEPKVRFYTPKKKAEVLAGIEAIKNALL